MINYNVKWVLKINADSFSKLSFSDYLKSFALSNKNIKKINEETLKQSTDILFIQNEEKSAVLSIKSQLLRLFSRNWKQISVKNLSLRTV